MGSNPILSAIPYNNIMKMEAVLLWGAAFLQFGVL